MCKKAMSSGAGAGSRKKLLGAGAAPKQAGSETLIRINNITKFATFVQNL